MLKNLFGGKKEDGFFAELKDEVVEKTEELKDKVEDTVDNIQDKVEEVKQVVQEKAEDAKQTAKETTTKSSKKKGKTDTATPVAAKVPAAEVPFWVKAIRSSKEIEKAAGGSGMTFSTDYLISNGTTSRRMPGPSLDPFKNMASQMKKPMR